MVRVCVHVLTAYNSPNSLALIYPLLINRPLLNKRGIELRFYGRLKDGFYDCDVIFIDSKFFRFWHAEKESKLYEVLSAFRKRAEKVFWFDTTDSTGTTQFNVMPFVDGYYKGQVLKDRSLYSKSLYGYRIFTDYYRTRFAINDESESSENTSKKSSVQTLLKAEDAHKLHLSWSSSMNEWGRYNYLYGNLEGQIRSHLPFGTDYTVRFVKANHAKSIDINGRIGLAHSKNTVKYQRQMIVDILRKKFDINTTKVSRKKYLNELRGSKIAVSPFGWGEISCRDFEIIINGALLFKGDMSHLETWPPLYAENETYVPYSWNLKDFEEKLRDILNDREKIIAISKKAQELYAHYLYGNGRIEFCDRVINIIGN